VRAALAAFVWLVSSAEARRLDEPPYLVAAGPEIAFYPELAAGVRLQVAFTEQLSALLGASEGLQSGVRALRLGVEYVIDTAPIVPVASLSACGYLGGGAALAVRGGLGLEAPWGPLALGAELYLEEPVLIAGRWTPPIASGAVGFTVRLALRLPFRAAAAPASR
jgi:hypothetical protein